MFVYVATVACFLIFTSLATVVLTRLVPSAMKPVPIDRSFVTQFPSGANAVPSSDGSALERFDAWFDRVVYFSGVSVQPMQVMLCSVLLSLTIAGIVFLFVDNLLITATVAILVFCVTMAVVMVMGQRRLNKFNDQLPDAMNLLAKAVQAGESFEQAVQLVGESSADPLGTEFRRAGGQLEMGLPIATSMRSLSNRVGSMDMQVFASTVAIHRQAGGNLSKTLDRLADVIRERMTYRRQMRSVTGAGRISALVISLMAPLIFLYLFFFQPQYGQGLWSDPLGKMLIIVAFVSQALGILWVKYILKNEY